MRKLSKSEIDKIPTKMMGKWCDQKRDKVKAIKAKDMIGITPNVFKRIGATKFDCSLETEFKSLDICMDIRKKYGITKFNRMTSDQIIEATKPWARSWKARKLAILTQQALKQDREITRQAGRV